MLKNSFLLLFLVFISSCEYFKQDTKQMPIARVNNTYLYANDIKDLVSQASSKTDSAILVSNYIKNWATKQLLIDRALVNLTPEQQEAFNKLVEDYKNELFTEAYKNNIVQKQLDSTILEKEYQIYYNQNKENFKLNDNLIQLRYVYVDKNYTNIDEIKKQLQDFSEADKIKLEENKLTFNKYNFNDSTWIRKENILQEIPEFKNQENQLLKKSNFVQLQDSIGVYLVKIREVLNVNDIAPLSYVKPTIKQIILNRRKLELLKKLETDITKDAQKNKKFEIYTPK
jgi:hypothetical protein